MKARLSLKTLSFRLVRNLSLTFGKLTLPALIMLLASPAWGDTSPRQCFTPVEVTTTWTQVICPNTAEEREVQKTGTTTVMMPTECPPSSTSAYGGSAPVAGSVVVSGSTGGQSGGGTSASVPPAATPIPDPG